MRPTWRNEHHGENLPDLEGMRFSRELFANCVLKRVKSTIFEHCSLQFSHMQPESLDDILGVTMTLDCFSFEDVEWNELSFDAILYLLTLTRGNDEKRAILRRMVSDKQLEAFDRVFKKVECRK